MKSIRAKLLIGILLILSIFVCGIMIYGINFKDYFKNQKLNEMASAIKETENILQEKATEKIVERLEEFSSVNNIQLDIINSSTGKALYSTHSSGGRGGMMNGMPGMSGMGGNRFETLEVIKKVDNITSALINDRSTGVKFLSSSKENLKGNYTITVKTPISEIADASKKSMELLTIILLPITIIAIMITIVFSRFFTKPIIAITKKTSRIESLDFNEVLDIKSSDEIGKLANSVNNLSKKIESTLLELSGKNESLEVVNESLMKMIDKERKNEVIRREFVSSVSHELKSPIAVISGYVQALQGGIIKEKEDKDYYLGVINEEAERMQIIVNDLLDLYKLESNTFKLEIKEVDIAALLRKIIRKNSLKFNEAGIILKSNISEGIVMADEIRLEQAIQNYINNALSHIDEKKELEINYFPQGRITVFNTGEKIQEENLEKIWHGFVRADKVRNYKEKRVGLGLAVVKQIINLHGGSCGVNNREDGVVFWIEI